jgi:uncharacterized membrane protein
MTASGPRAQQASVLAANVASALCYVLGLITGIVFLVIPPYNRNPAIRFHAFQSIFANVACIALSIGLSIVFDALQIWRLDSLVSLAIFLLFIYLAFQAYQGKTIELPVIGPLARQQAGV